MLKMGSLCSGIGGLELGLERAFNGHLNTVWQVEENEFCLSILERHWPHTKRYTDVRTVRAHTLETVDIICAGFPCQSISIAGNQKGLEDENKSGLWWHVHRIVSEFQSIGHQPILVLENVSNILRLGGRDVVASLAQIGYDCEWTIISARQCGAPHVRKRWFCVAYPNSIGCRTSDHTQREHQHRIHQQGDTTQGIQQRGEWQSRAGKDSHAPTNTNSQRVKEQPIRSESVGQTRQSECRSGQTQRSQQNYWERFPTQSPVCRRDDGIPHRVDRIKALGNAVVPQCSEWVGQQIIKSGLLERLCLANN